MMPRSGSGDVAAGQLPQSICALIDRWQTDHDCEALAALLELIHEPLERLVAQTLRRRGLRDPGACDDAWALVMEHIARLGNAAGTRSISAFDACRHGQGGTRDPGWAYLRCVARSRARDIARDRRRRDRQAEVVGGMRSEVAGSNEADAAPGAAPERLRAAVAKLDQQSQTVIALLLDGKSQVVIAHLLGVCEGTVSRIRSRAIAKLRDLMAE